MIVIRRDESNDNHQEEETINAIIKAAFNGEEEVTLVRRLRLSPTVFVPELALVAVSTDTSALVGHILLTRLKIQPFDNTEMMLMPHDDGILALAPLAVLPSHQRHGVGTHMVKHALSSAKQLGFRSVIVLGHPEYYHRFGFQPASRWNIHAPFQAPDEAFMALELVEGALVNHAGTVVYPDAFGLL